MGKIFDKPASVYITDTVKSAKVAEISVSSADGTISTANLPIVSIGEMSHHSRQQLDCSLDGTLHVLSAAGGLGACTITFMDRLMKCGDGGVNADSLSALHQYSKLRKNLKGAQVKIRIFKAGSSSKLATFEGVVKSCTATASNRQGIDILLVTYSLIGVME